METTFKHINYLKKDGVAKITLNRPDVLNAINRAMRMELLEAVNDVRSDESIRVVVLTGAGRAFCSGADVSELSAAVPGTEVSANVLARSLLTSIETCTKPVIAAINGLTLGGGLELALSCDFRIAKASAELGQPEINLGIIPGSGGTQRLPRLVGVARAKEMIMFAQRIQAPEAERLNLINKAVPDEEFDMAVEGWVSALKEKPPIALAMAKLAINKVWDFSSLDSGLLFEREVANLCRESYDAREGMKAFLERRKPQFRGS